MDNSHRPHCSTCTCLTGLDTFIRTGMTRDTEHMVNVADLYTAYCRYTAGQPVLTQNQFTRHLRVLGYNLTRRTQGNYIVAHRFTNPAS